MPTPLTTSGQVATADAATVTPVANLLAAAQQLTNFTVPAEDLPTAGSGAQTLGIIGDLNTKFLAWATGLGAAIHALALQLEALLPSAGAQTLDHLTMTPSTSSVMETGTAPTLTLGQYQTSDSSTPYTDTLSPANAFTSSNTGVATIGPTTGLITLQGPGTTTITRTAGGKTVSFVLTVTAEVLSATPSSLSGNPGDVKAALVIRDQSSVNVTSGCTFTTTDASIATVNSSGVVTLVADGTCDIVAHHTVDGETCTIAVTVATAGTYTKLKFDDMGYLNQPAFLARVTASSAPYNDGDPGGTSGTSPAFYDAANWQYNSATGLTQECLVVDSSAEALYNGQSTIRQDFPPRREVDKAPVLRIPLGGEYSAIGIRARIKFDSGSVSGRSPWTLAGDPTLADYQTVYGSDPLAGGYDHVPAAAYKTIAWEGTNVSGRMEFTDTLDFYEDRSNALSAMGNLDVPTTSDFSEFADNLWHDYIILRLVDVTNKIQVMKLYRCSDGGTPTLLGVAWGRNNDGTNIPTINMVKYGLNYNQFRVNLISLWRGPWEVVDLAANSVSAVATAWSLPAASLYDLTTPTAPTVAYSSATTSSLAYSVTAASGLLPLEVTAEVFSGGVWTAQTPTRWTAAAGGTQVVSVTGLTDGTNYSNDIRFKFTNLAGTSATTLATTGSTAVDLGMPAGCVWAFEVDGNTDVSTDGASVSTWNDISGSALQFAYSGTKPVLKKAQLNGHDVIRFSGGAKMALTSNPLLMDQEGTVILVAKFASTGNCVPLDSNGSWYYLNSGGGYGFITPHGAYFRDNATFPISTTAWKYLTYRGRPQSAGSNPGPVNYNVDDAVVQSDTDSGTSTMHGTGNPTLGSDLAGANTADMDVAAIFAFDHYLSDTDLAAAAARIRTLYGTGNFA